MNINGFQVEEHGSGYAVTIRLRVGAQELADDWIGKLFARLKAGGDLFDDTSEERCVPVAAAEGYRNVGTAVAEAIASHEKPEPEPISTRRRRGSREPEKKDPDPTSPAPVAENLGRRGRRSAQPAEKKSPSKLSDEDLTKAASAAARKVGVIKVSAVLEEFGVAKVNELQGDAREEFLSRVQSL